MADTPTEPTEQPLAPAEAASSATPDKPTDTTEIADTTAPKEPEVIKNGKKLKNFWGHIIPGKSEKKDQKAEVPSEGEKSESPAAKRRSLFSSGKAKKEAPPAQPAPVPAPEPQESAAEAVSEESPAVEADVNAKKEKEQAEAPPVSEKKWGKFTFFKKQLVEAKTEEARTEAAVGVTNTGETVAESSAAAAAEVHDAADKAVKAPEKVQKKFFFRNLGKKSADEPKKEVQQKSTEETDESKPQETEPAKESAPEPQTSADTAEVTGDQAESPKSLPITRRLTLLFKGPNKREKKPAEATSSKAEDVTKSEGEATTANESPEPVKPETQAEPTTEEPEPKS